MFETSANETGNSVNETAIPIITNIGETMASFSSPDCNLSTEIMENPDDFNKTHKTIETMLSVENGSLKTIPNDKGKFDANDPSEDTELTKPKGNSDNLQELETNPDVKRPTASFLDIEGNYTINLDDDQMKYECNKCGSSYRDINYLKQHYNMHLDPFYLCTRCQKTFIKQHEFKHHLETNCKELYTCELCGKTFKANGGLLHHFKVKHKYKCTICDKSFKSHGRLNFHQRCHMDARPPCVCLHCGDTFKSAMDLRRHEKTHKKVQLHLENLETNCKEGYICEWCGKIFKAKQTLEKHSRSHTNGRKCKICNKKFKQRTRLHAHQRLFHSDLLPNLCLYCGKTFVTKCHLLNHMIVHNQRRKKHQCDQCNIDTKCDQCGITFETKHYLYLHMQSHVEKKKTYQCNICQKIYSQITNFRRHKKTHGKEYSACKYCGATFTRISDLIYHETTHTGKNRRHYCDQCNRSFVKIIDLNKHKLIHKKWHQCPNCLKKYREAKVLRLHLKICTKPTKTEFVHVNNLKSELIDNSDDFNITENIIEVMLSEDHGSLETITNDEGNFDCNDPLEEKISGNLTKITDDLINSTTAELQTNPDIQRHVDIEGNYSMKLVDNKTKYICNKCGSSFQKFGWLKKHFTTHLDDFYICTRCQKTFNCQSKFKVHLETNCKEVYECERCSKTFINKQALWAHKKEHKHKCEICGKIFNRHNQLNLHRKTHGDALFYNCLHCDDAFKTKADLKCHELTHIDEKHQCGHCDKVFKDEYHLESHKQIHENNDPITYECDQCGKSYKKQDFFIKHMQFHAEQKFECGVCLKKFSRANELRLHKKSHSDVYNICRYCSEPFEFKSSLIHHEKIHTKCDRCDQVFKDVRCLKAHRKTHLTSGQQCNVCLKTFKQASSLQRHLQICKKALGNVDESEMSVEMEIKIEPETISHICADEIKMKTETDLNLETSTLNVDEEEAPIKSEIKIENENNFESDIKTDVEMNNDKKFIHLLLVPTDTLRGVPPLNYYDAQ